MTQITNLAIHISSRMRRDWISVGRRPDGVCVSSLLIACRAHDFYYSVGEMARLFRMSPQTIKDRLEEFEATPSSHLTKDQFATLETHLPTEFDPPSFIQDKVAKNPSEVAVDVSEWVQIGDENEENTPLDLPNIKADRKKKKRGKNEEEEEDQVEMKEISSKDKQPSSSSSSVGGLIKKICSIYSQPEEKKEEIVESKQHTSEEEEEEGKVQSPKPPTTTAKKTRKSSTTNKKKKTSRPNLRMFGAEGIIDPTLSLGTTGRKGRMSLQKRRVRRRWEKVRQSESQNVYLPIWQDLIEEGSKDDLTTLSRIILEEDQGDDSDIDGMEEEEEDMTPGLAKKRRKIKSLPLPSSKHLFLSSSSKDIKDSLLEIESTAMEEGDQLINLKKKRQKTNKQQEQKEMEEMEEEEGVLFSDPFSKLGHGEKRSVWLDNVDEEEEEEEVGGSGKVGLLLPSDKYSPTKRKRGRDEMVDVRGLDLRDVLLRDERDQIEKRKREEVGLPPMDKEENDKKVVVKKENEEMDYSSPSEDEQEEDGEKEKEKGDKLLVEGRKRRRLSLMERLSRSTISGPEIDLEFEDDEEVNSVILSQNEVERKKKLWNDSFLVLFIFHLCVVFFNKYFISLSILIFLVFSVFFFKRNI